MRHFVPLEISHLIKKSCLHPNLCKFFISIAFETDIDFEADVDFEEFLRFLGQKLGPLIY